MAWRMESRDFTSSGLGAGTREERLGGGLGAVSCLGVTFGEEGDCARDVLGTEVSAANKNKNIGARFIFLLCCANQLIKRDCLPVAILPSRGAAVLRPYMGASTQLHFGPGHAVYAGS